MEEKYLLVPESTNTLINNDNVGSNYEVNVMIEAPIATHISDLYSLMS